MNNDINAADKFTGQEPAPREETDQMNVNPGTMPVLFVGHGSPMNAIEENEFTAGWKKASANIPKPVAILCISAHWETKGTLLTAMEFPKTIHDFGGFPGELYKVLYPAPGSPKLAEEIRNIVGKTPVGMDYSWGLDHGTWSVLKHFFPGADVPVIQMSLDYNMNARQHYELAGELKKLRKKGILIVGSGNMVHNLRMADWNRLNDEYGYDWAIEAEERMKKLIIAGDHGQLVNYENQGRAFNLAIPSPEHYLPLLYILALKDEKEKVIFFNDKPVGGSLTMTSLTIEAG